MIEEVATGSTPSLSIAVALNGRVLWEEAFWLLARVLEQASIIDFPTNVRANVLSPLGMETAQVYVGDDLPGPTATSYYGVNGEPVPRKILAYRGNGDMYCSVHDLLRFAMFHLKDHLPGQGRVLSDSMIDGMQKGEHLHSG